MSELLALARDYLERMSNPLYGSTINEDYAARFGQLLGTEDFDRRLTEEIRTLHNKEALTSNGWMWLLRWVRSRDIGLSETLLLELFEEFASIPARCLIVELGTRGAELDEAAAATLYDFPNPFLAKILRGATEFRDEALQAFRELELERLSARAESVLLVLLQVGTPLTIRAASVLLKHQWSGHEQLVQFIRAIASRLDEETRAVWATGLGIAL